MNPQASRSILQGLYLIVRKERYVPENYTDFETQSNARNYIRLKAYQQDVKNMAAERRFRFLCQTNDRLKFEKLSAAKFSECA